MIKKSKYSYENLDLVNASVLLGFPVLFAISLYYHVRVEGFNPALLIPFGILSVFTGISITAGYHRLFAHRAYKAHPLVKLFYLIFGAAAVQNSALKWSTDHRRHHNDCDTETDPYNINEGFFYAHMGWVLIKEKDEYKDKYVRDLEADPLVMWQHKHYLAIVLASALFFPLIIGYLMGSPVGGLAIIVLGRLIFVHHATFFINSLCHTLGSQPYTDSNTAKDSMLMAFFTYGEGYHNFHHIFQTDYRNGIRWYQWDPTKWLIFGLNKLGLADHLKKTPEAKILQARMAMRVKTLKDKKPFIDASTIENLQQRVEAAQKRWQELKKEYEEMKANWPADKAEKIRQFKENMANARADFKRSYQNWLEQIQSLEAQPVFA